MYLWVSLFIFWTATLNLTSGLSQKGDTGYPTYSDSELRDFVSPLRREITLNEEIANSIDDGRRRKRALYGVFGFGVMRGLQTARTLLDGARHLFTLAENTRVFVKKGDYGTAKEDFRTARLSAVDKFELPGGVEGKIGESGDRIVTIQTFGESGNPTMKIIRQSVNGIEDVDVVVYVK